jgi:hypothetical protein
LVDVGVATAQIVEFLSALFGLFSWELSCEVSDGAVVVLEAVVAVADVEADVVVFLDGLQSFLETLFQLLFFLFEEVEGGVVLSFRVEA